MNEGLETKLMTTRDVRKFAELTDAEKIERLHQVIVDMRRSLGYAFRHARQAYAMAEHHEHGRDGRPMFSRSVIENSLSHEAGSSGDSLA